MPYPPNKTSNIYWRKRPYNDNQNNHAKLSGTFLLTLYRFATTPPANATLTATCAAGTAIACAASASVKPLGRVTRANAKKISQSANPLTRQVGICFNLMFVSQWKLISLFSCHLIITSILRNIFPYKSLQSQSLTDSNKTQKCSYTRITVCYRNPATFRRSLDPWLRICKK